MTKPMRNDKPDLHDFADHYAFLAAEAEKDMMSQLK